LKSIQLAKGLGSNQVDLENSVASGVSKIIDSADIQEMRKDDVRVLQDFEQELFKATLAVYNYHSGKKIKEDAEFEIKFLEPKVTETTDEKNKKREAGLKNGTMSRVDIIMADNNCSREEAKQKLRQIIAENKEFDDEFGLNEGAMDEGEGQVEELDEEELAALSPEDRMAYEKKQKMLKSKQPPTTTVRSDAKPDLVKR
jgi:hypothetical protein